jgi:hypothetical protein
MGAELSRNPKQVERSVVHGLLKAKLFVLKSANPGKTLRF